MYKQRNMISLISRMSDDSYFIYRYLIILNMTDKQQVNNRTFKYYYRDHPQVISTSEGHMR